MANFENQEKKLVKEIKVCETVTKLYQRFDNTYFVIKRDLEGRILKTNMDISYGDNSSTNKINAIKAFNIISLNL
jgi:hypothetical protein